MEDSIKQALIFIFSGAGATILGFCLTMLWSWCDNLAKSKLVLKALTHDLLINRDTLINNLDSLNQELEIIQNDRYIVKPLNLLNQDFLNFLYINLPKKFKKEPNLLSEIRDLSRLSKESNETILSRENYRISNTAMSNYQNRMKIYDEILQRQENELLDLVEIFLKK